MDGPNHWVEKHPIPAPPIIHIHILDAEISLKQRKDAETGQVKRRSGEADSVVTLFDQNTEKNLLMVSPLKSYLCRCHYAVYQCTTSLLNLPEGPLQTSRLLALPF